MGFNSKMESYHHFHDYLESIKPELDDAFSRKLSLLLGRIPLKDYPLLTEALITGKKLRGCLSCMISDALGGRLTSAIPRAIAVELIHVATLIHDDFVDQDTSRRNKPAVWTLEGARRAVLIGDVLFATAVKMMTDLSMEDGSVISLAIAQMSKGALREPLDSSVLIGEIESGRLDENLYEEIIYLKTGVLFGTACRLGAIAAGADPPLQEMSFRYGLRIGEAYQMADDLDDLHDLLATGALRREEVIPLVPMFLYFGKEMQPWILEVLRGGRQGMADGFLRSSRSVEKRMRHELKLRLEAAVSEIDGKFPDHSRLIRKAPWDLIRIFSHPADIRPSRR